MPFSYFNKKRTVEIYFILYLAALMLLIPDMKEKNDLSNSNTISDNTLFKIFPEKTVLNTRISFDSTGFKVLNSDSVNLIYYSGNVKDIEFDFQIENKLLNQVLNINSESNIRNYFKYRDVPELKAVYFIWKPPVIDKRSYVYNVKVSANAILEIIDPTTKNISFRKYNSKTQFSLVVSYFDNQTGMPYFASKIDSVPFMQSGQASNEIFNNTGEIFFDFENKKVNSLISEEWTNKINIWGINLNNELGSKPELRITNFPENNSGTAYIKQITNNSIVVSGRTPQYGNSKVNIKFTRKSDKSIIQDEFVVYPIPLIEPSYPSIAYPLQSYRIDPNFPEINDKNYMIKISLENKTIYNSYSNNSFNFIPEENQIGKTLYLERFINGSLYGKSYPIYIKQYPPPQIVRIQNIGSKKTRIIVNCFGYVDNNENFIKTVDINGNAIWNEILGQSSFNRSNLMLTQVFEIRAKNENQPFEYKIRVQDQRGNWSSTVNYP